MRDYLNNELIREIFSKEETCEIKISEIGTINQDGVESYTQDKLFLLNAEEWEKYFGKINYNIQRDIQRSWLNTDLRCISKTQIEDTYRLFVREWDRNDDRGEYVWDAACNAYVGDVYEIIDHQAVGDNPPTPGGGPQDEKDNSGQEHLGSEYLGQQAYEYCTRALGGKIFEDCEQDYPQYHIACWVNY